MRRAVCLTLVLAATGLLAGCGSDNDDRRRPPGGGQLSQEGDRKGAQEAVRNYLLAIVERDSESACGLLAPEYQKQLLAESREFASKAKADNCVELLNAVNERRPPAMFEERRIDSRSVGRLDLRVTVRKSGQGQNATVTGPRGIERYRLEIRDGKWLITRVERGVG